MRDLHLTADVSKAQLKSLVEATKTGMSSALAIIVDNIDFTPEEHRRAEVLAERADAGELTDDERAEYAELVEMNQLLGILLARSKSASQSVAKAEAVA